MSNNRFLDAYKRASDIPLLVLSILFVGILVISNFHFDIAEQNQDLFSKMNLFIWLVFAADFALLLVSAESKKTFLKTHWIDLALVLLPFLRVLRIIRVGMLFFRKIDSFKNRFMISIPIYTVTSTLLFTILGASAVYDAEFTNENGNIKTPGDALWWAVVTVFTVGYGDKFPVTTEGRWYAAGLMICGIAVVGSVTATFASWLISQVREVESEQEKILEKLAAIEEGLNSKK
ncbi:MAG: pH-gated potassium channel KcsA [Actinomycetota bacterium]